ncbi:TetR/AcrR family transcriptional regulator [Streptomyces sp. NPDC051940]|uniref:TetR/AcrR family transcriptional regulator n=1 Tax=Streptomyces sp. NPDC051940 TaxID=3155675 RepID=UPI00342955F1
MGLRERHEHWRDPRRGGPRGDRGQEPSRRARGRPRSEAVERAITEGVLHLLEEGATLGELTIEKIARTAGVGKATIYRRWAGKEELLVDVLAELEGAYEIPLTGESARDDLIACLQAVLQRGVTKRSSALWRAVMVEARGIPKVSKLYHESVVEHRRETMRSVLRHGIETGELREDLDLDLTVDILVGPVLVRTVVHEWKPIEDDFAARVVDAFLEGARPR